MTADRDDVIVQALNEAPFALSLEELLSLVGGPPKDLLAALERLATDGRVRTTTNRVDRAYYIQAWQLR